MERLLNIISFIILLTGLYTVLNISIFELTDDISKLLSREKKDIKSKIKNQTRKKKEKGIRKIIEESKSILLIMGKGETINLVWLISIILL